MSSKDISVSYSSARIAALYAQGLVDYLTTRGFRARPGLVGTSLSGVESASGETSLAAWITLLEFAADELGEPDLPAKAGASLEPRHLGALGQVLINCGDLDDAYQQLARYIRLVGQIGQPLMLREGAHARLLWQWPYLSPPPQSVALFMLAARVRFMRWLVNRPDLKLDAGFHGDAPGPVESFEKIFGGRVSFGQPESSVIFPADWLRLRVVLGGEAQRRQAEVQAQQRLLTLSEERSLELRVRSLIEARLSSGEVGLDQIALLLSLSARSLQRRLADAGLGYQSLLEDVRAQRAAQLLRDATRPLAEVAFLLGYSDQSSFHTAYRRWFNTSPGKARRAL